MGLGPGGQPINANRLSSGGGMGSGGQSGGHSPFCHEKSGKEFFSVCIKLSISTCNTL